MGRHRHDCSRFNHLGFMSMKIRLGDIVARITKFLRIPHCKNCEKRRVILNEASDVGIRETLKRLEHCCD